MADVEYVVCPLCGMSRVRFAKKKGYAMWPGYQIRVSTDIAPTFFNSDGIVMQVRTQGGKIGGTGAKGKGGAPGYGFRADPSKCLSLSQIVGEPKYSEDIATLALAVKNAYDQFKAVGLIK